VLKYQSSSAVVSNSVHDAEVYHYREEKQKVFIGFLKVVDGAVVQGHTTELTGGTDESREERLSLAIQSIRSESQTDAQELIVPFMPEWLHEDGLTITIPKRGEKRQLLELCERNVKYYLLEKRKQERIVDPDAHFQRILDQTQEDLRMKESPRHIECFDNSNLQGNQPVAACVVFKDGRPSKKDYRHFNIKTVEGPDDFASMREVVHRRYKRLLEESEPLPQLIVIDGGKGQLSAAVESLEILGLRGQITVIGIAKRLEEIYFPGDSVPLHIDKRSESLKLIQQLRNEAHRFGITHHRNRRSKAAIKSTLTEIEGIGETTAQKLLKHFGSVKNVKEANEEQLAKLIGKAKSRTIFSYFHPD
jgi:excinuclease ABC subunit C